MVLPMTDKLRLKAGDAEDLAVIAACLQDARIPLREMAYLPGEKRFVAVFVRFRREKQKDPRDCEGLTECASAVVFDGIEISTSFAPRSDNILRASSSTRVVCSFDAS